MKLIIYGDEKTKPQNKEVVDQLRRSLLDKGSIAMMIVRHEHAVRCAQSTGITRLTTPIMASILARESKRYFVPGGGGGCGGGGGGRILRRGS